jgi:hypothetical protein
MALDLDFLIRAFDSTHPDPVKDARGCHKKGDIIDVQLNGFEWGSEELNTDLFYVVTVVGVPIDDISEAKKYMQPYVDQSDPDPKNWVTVRRHRYQVRVDDLPTNLHNNVMASKSTASKSIGGKLTPPEPLPPGNAWDDMKGFIRNHETGLDES